MDIGQEIVSAYLQVIKGCEFVQQNLYLPDVQAEIDVIGIDLQTKTLYVCEVAIHLPTGLQYVKNKQPDNVGRLIAKFSKDIEYTNEYFRGYENKHFMLWSPIVKSSGGTARHNQMNDVAQVQSKIKAEEGVVVELIINEKFEQCLSELRTYASKQTKELKSPVLRYLQIESYLSKHLKKLSVKQSRTALQQP